MTGVLKRFFAWFLAAAISASCILIAGLAWADYDRHFQGAAKKFFGPVVDWRWFKAQAITESGLNPMAMSPMGAKGLMQLMPGTSRELADRLDLADAPFDPHLNIIMGVAYNRRLWDFWHAPRPTLERLRLVFASYNAGPGNILQAQILAGKQGDCSLNWACLVPWLPRITGRHARETRGYVRKVEGHYRRLIVAGKP